MNDTLKFIRDLIITVTVLVSMIFMPVKSEGYEAKNPDEAKLVFSAVSDVHVESNNPASYQAFEKVLRDIKNNKSSDATVFLGDNTMNGQTIENTLFFGGVKALLNDKNTFVAVGNHDLGNGEEDYDKMFSRFKSYHNAHLKNKLDKPYYYKVVNGIYMIFLSTEKASVNSMYMSDEQFSWFEGVLNEAAQTDGPVFVFAHHPPYALDNEDSSKLVSLLNKYEDIFYIHGHIHSYSVYTQGKVNCINLPRVTEVVDYEPGVGIVVEVYEDEILVRVRNFVTGEWLEELKY